MTGILSLAAFKALYPIQNRSSRAYDVPMSTVIPPVVGSALSVSDATIRFTTRAIRDQEAVFVVSLTPASGRVVTINYATRDGTATTANGDYVGRGGTLTFIAGQALQEITVPVANPISELVTSAMFYLDLSWPTSDTTDSITRNSAICTLPGYGS